MLWGFIVGATEWIRTITFIPEQRILSPRRTTNFATVAYSTTLPDISTMRVTLRLETIILGSGGSMSSDKKLIDTGMVDAAVLHLALDDLNVIVDR